MQYTTHNIAHFNKTFPFLDLSAGTTSIASRSFLDIWTILLSINWKISALMTASAIINHDHTPKAVATGLNEVRSRARFKVSEAGRMRSVQIWCSQLMRRLPRGRQTRQTAWECRHLQQSRLRKQMSQKPLAQDRQRVQTDPRRLLCLMI